MYDNGEPYEDGVYWIKKVFKSKSSALAYIRSEGYTVEDKYTHRCYYTNLFNNYLSEKEEIEYYLPEYNKYDYRDFMYIEEHILK